MNFPCGSPAVLLTSPQCEFTLMLRVLERWWKIEVCLSSILNMDKITNLVTLSHLARRDLFLKIMKQY